MNKTIMNVLLNQNIQPLTIVWLSSSFKPTLDDICGFVIRELSGDKRTIKEFFGTPSEKLLEFEHLEACEFNQLISPRAALEDAIKTLCTNRAVILTTNSDKWTEMVWRVLSPELPEGVSIDFCDTCHVLTTTEDEQALAGCIEALECGQDLSANVKLYEGKRLPGIDALLSTFSDIEVECAIGQQAPEHRCNKQAALAEYALNKFTSIQE